MGSSMCTKRTCSNNEEKRNSTDRKIDRTEQVKIKIQRAEIMQKNIGGHHIGVMLVPIHYRAQ